MDTKQGLRSVLEFAREVRVHLHKDEAVIVGSMKAGDDATPDVFRMMPWGTTTIVTIRLDEVSRAAPVHGMTWDEQRLICTAQRTGVFERSSLLHAARGRRALIDSVPSIPVSEPSFALGRSAVEVRDLQ